EHKNENGYRYYSVHQAEVFSVIEMLKEIGMSLAEIKEFLHFQTPEETIALLTNKQEIMKRKIEKMQRTQQMIQNKIKHIKDVLQLNVDCFTIEKMGIEYFVLSESILNSSDKEFSSFIMSFIKYTKVEELYISELIGGLNSKDQIESGEYLSYAQAYISVDQCDVGDLVR